MAGGPRGRCDLPSARSRVVRQLLECAEERVRALAGARLHAEAAVPPRGEDAGAATRAFDRRSIHAERSWSDEVAADHVGDVADHFVARRSGAKVLGRRVGWDGYRVAAQPRAGTAAAPGGTARPDSSGGARRAAATRSPSDSGGTASPGGTRGS